MISIAHLLLLLVWMLMPFIKFRLENEMKKVLPLAAVLLQLLLAMLICCHQPNEPSVSKTTFFSFAFELSHHSLHSSVGTSCNKTFSVARRFRYGATSGKIL